MKPKPLLQCDSPSRPRLHIFLVLVIGLVASAVAYNVGRNFEETRTRASFERAAGGRIAAVQASILSTIGSLRALASFFEATEGVSSAQFAKFVAPLLIAYPDIQAYEWVPRVEDRDRGSIERAANAVFPGFRIGERNAGGNMVVARSRALYYPVYFVEPLLGNEAAVGFDLGSSATRLAAIKEAELSGYPQATGRVTLVQETSNQYGVLVFVPVSKPDHDGENRQGGVVLGVFRIGDVVSRAIEGTNRNDEVDIRMWDRSAPESEALLFPKDYVPRRRGADAPIATSRQWDVGGRRWEIEAVASPEYLAREGRSVRFSFVAAVMLVTLNIAWIMHRRFMIEDEVVARTADMRAARDQARDAMRAKSNFLATMSHEIRTPMNAIVAMTDHLLEGGPVLEQKEPLHIIAKSSEHLLHVINDILDLSKLEARKIDLEAHSISIEKKVDTVIEMLASDAREKGIVITSTIDTNVPEHVIGDPARVRQILLNLASNAVKFTKKGTVEIRVALGTGETERFIPITITVSDTGIGMTDAAISHLFTEFWQADSSISRRYGGTGLGLAITRRLVDQMNGTINVKSVPGERIAFTITLPFGKVPLNCDDSRLITPKDDSADINRFNGLRVLLVEDNLTNRHIAKKILARFGAEVVVATDGFEAVDAVGTGEYDIILMDVHMPSMNGLEASRAIRVMDPPRCAVPIVALTASAFSEDLAQCAKAGMTGFCAKPYRSRELAAAMVRALRKVAA